MQEGFKDWLAAAAMGAAAMTSPVTGAGQAQQQGQVQQASTGGSIKGNWDDGFLQYVMRVENASKEGRKDGIWMPHGSPEGGTPTLGYGHKMTKEEQRTGVLWNGMKWRAGLTDSQIHELMMDDLGKQWDEAASFVRIKYGVDMSRLPAARQEMLLDMEYNPGLSLFPKFTKAVIEGNWDPKDPASAVNQYKRHLNGKELGRNRHFADRYFDGFAQADSTDYSE